MTATAALRHEHKPTIFNSVTRLATLVKPGHLKKPFLTWSRNEPFHWKGLNRKMHYSTMVERSLLCWKRLQGFLCTVLRCFIKYGRDYKSHSSDGYVRLIEVQVWTVSHHEQFKISFGTKNQQVAALLKWQGYVDKHCRWVLKRYALLIRWVTCLRKARLEWQHSGFWV